MIYSILPSEFGYLFKILNNNFSCLSDLINLETVEDSKNPDLLEINKLFF